MHLESLKALSEVSEIIEINDISILHPEIEVSDESNLYLAIFRGESTFLKVEKTPMDNSDGSSWTRPWQTKNVLYYLSSYEDDGKRIFNWYFHSNI